MEGTYRNPARVTNLCEVREDPEPLPLRGGHAADQVGVIQGSKGSLCERDARASAPERGGQRDQSDTDVKEASQHNTTPHVDEFVGEEDRNVLMCALAMRSFAFRYSFCVFFGEGRIGWEMWSEDDRPSSFESPDMR